MEDLITNRTPGLRQIDRSCIARTALVSLAILAAPSPSSSQAIPNPPIPHRQLNDSVTAKPGAHFGRCFGMGKVGPPGDAEDDVVVCATQETLPDAVGAPADGTGAAYCYQGVNLALTAGTHMVPPIEQVSIEHELGLGMLDVAIGNVLGPSNANLVFVAAAHQDRDVTLAGAVDVYNMNSAAPNSAVLVIEPPLDPPSPEDDCPLPLVTPAARFGHGIAIADVDGDGTDDLIVGASDTTEKDSSGCTRTPHGRVYIFFGHLHFLDEHYPGPSDPPGYLYRCAAIKAPQVFPPGPPCFVSNGFFGLSVDAADLDGDGKAEILVGRSEDHGGLDRGRAHLFYGTWIAGQVPSPQPWSMQFPVLVTPLTGNKNLGVQGQFETLLDTTDSDTDKTAFGFNVFMLRKSVGSAAGTMDTKPDIAIYSDKAKQNQANPVKSDAGALWVFFNDSVPSVPHSLVNEAAGFKIQTPTSLGVPATYPRFGFAAAAISWASTGGTTPTYLLVGEPNATVQSTTHAGRVLMFATPLDVSIVPGTLNSVITPLSDQSMQPFQRDTYFGQWLAVGNYDSAYLGEEFVIAEHGKNWSPTVQQAGQAITYRSGP